MAEEFRKLNDRGLQEFATWIKEGGKGLLPLYLLESTEYSSRTDYILSTNLPILENRFEFGKYLVELLQHIPHLEIENDINFWSSLALVWFDSISSKTETGQRSIREMSCYVLKLDWHDFRHLVRTPWLLVRLHGETAKFLLVSSKNEDKPLSVTGGTLETIGSRQTLIRNQKVIKVLSKLYFDEKKKQLKKGIFSEGGGTPFRTGVIVRQLALTYDLDQMPEKAIFDILPREYDKWKRGVSFD